MIFNVKFGLNFYINVIDKAMNQGRIKSHINVFLFIIYFFQMDNLLISSNNCWILIVTILSVNVQSFIFFFWVIL